MEEKLAAVPVLSLASWLHLPVVVLYNSLRVWTIYMDQENGGKNGEKIVKEEMKKVNNNVWPKGFGCH